MLDSDVEYMLNHMLNKKYRNPSGTWEVTTEKDVEGRTSRRLGVYTGYVDEIALHLADKSYYSLKFTRVGGIGRRGPYSPTRDSVDVHFNPVNSNIGDMLISVNFHDKIKDLMEEVFKDRPIIVEPSGGYACFKIKAKSEK